MRRLSYNGNISDEDLFYYPWYTEETKKFHESESYKEMQKQLEGRYSLNDKFNRMAERMFGKKKVIKT